MYHEDWLMRQIQITIRAIAAIVFGRDSVLFEAQDDRDQTESEELDLRLSQLLEKGEVNEAENLLFDRINPEDSRDLQVALRFYSKLNDWSDEELETGNFSRVEIESGLEDIKDQFGISF